MRRFPLAVWALVALAAPSFGQSSNRDTVVYLDRKDGKVVTLSDTLVKKDSAAGVEIPIGTEARFIPAPDIVRIDYGNLPGVTQIELSAIRGLEDSGDLVKARARYAELLKKVGGQSPKARRYFAFREAMTAAAMADRLTDPSEFRAEGERAAALLTDFALENSSSWEVWPALRTAARFAVEQGDFAAAAALLGKLAANPELTPDLRYEARLAELAAQLRAGTNVSATIDELTRDSRFPASGPLRQRLAILTAAAKPANSADAIPALDKAIADATDPEARALGFALLGDRYRTLGKNRDALWSYLWVDVVYPQDRFERVLALHRLVELFDAQGDPDRTAQFREKLTTAR